MLLAETLSIFDDDHTRILSDWKNYPINYPRHAYRSSCYAVFNTSIYKINKKYYFSFPLMPPWYIDLVSELNSLFTNIKYGVIDDKNIYKIPTLSSWSSISYVSEDNLESALLKQKTTIDKATKYNSPLFTVEISNEYKQGVRPHLYYILHHILRQISIGEGSVDVSVHTKNPKDIFGYKSVIDYVLYSNNCHRGYRSLAEINLKIDDLLRLDNIDLVNEYISDVGIRLTQTEVFMNLNWSNYYKIPKNTLVVEIGKRPYYFGTGMNEPRKPGKLIALGKSGRVFIERDGKAFYTNIDNRIVPLTFEEVEKGKFKIGQLIIPKVGFEYQLPKLARVKNNYAGGFLKIDILDNKYKADNDCFNEDNFKILPKTMYSKYGIEENK